MLRGFAPARDVAATDTGPARTPVATLRPPGGIMPRRTLDIIRRRMDPSARSGDCRMPKIANLLLLVVGVALAGLGLATASTDRSAWAVMALGAVVGTLALASDAWRKRRALRRQQAALPARIDELMRQVLRGHPLRLPMPFRAVLIVALLAIAVPPILRLWSH